MEKILDVINHVKHNINVLNYDEIKKNIETILQDEIANNFFNDEDIDFIIDIITDNIDLDQNTLKEIICNLKKKIEYKILVSNDENNSEIINNFSKETNHVYNILLDIFSKFGYVFIHPEKLVILWNEKDLKNSDNSILFKYDKKSNKTLLNYSNTEALNKDTEYIIKYVNYDLILNTNNFKNYPAEIFNNFNRKIGIFEDKNGFNTNFQLEVYNNQMTIHNIHYKGLITIFFNNKKKTFFLNDQKSVEKILNYYKKDIIKIFKKNKIYGLKLQYTFLKNEFLKNYMDFILKIFEYDDPKLYKLKEETNHINIYINKTPENNFFEIENKCPHEETITNFFKDQNNYFKNLGEFIENNIDYKDDIAVCKLCGEIITNLNLNELNDFDSTKYVGYINNILDFPPYNNIFNSKYYFENFFFLFNNYTKINFINNTDYIIKISLDNFIYISSNRLELEYKYKEDINNNNIFFIRFSNNFFEIDLEKEKYSEKKTVFTYFLIIMILCSFLTIKEYNHLIFVKKIINLKKLKKYENIDFDNILTIFIIFLFKNLNIEFYDGKNKFERINRTIKIYKNIINDELKTIYFNKAKLIENFIITKRNIDYNLYINYTDEVYTSPYSDLDDHGNYLLEIENIYNNILYNPEYNFFSLCNFNINENNIQYEKEYDDSVFIDFNELKNFDIEKKYQKLFLNVSEQFNNIKYFLYKNKQCTIKSLSEQKIVKNQVVNKNINYATDIGISINDLSENINKNKDDYVDDDNTKTFISKRNEEILNSKESKIDKKINNESITEENIGGSKFIDNQNIDENVLNDVDNNFLLIFNNKTIFKTLIELENIEPDIDSVELKFFLNGDKYVFIKTLNKEQFLEVIEEFISFLEIFFNILIKSNFYEYFKNNYYNYYDKNTLIKIKFFIVIFLIKKNILKENFINTYVDFLDHNI